MSDEVRVNPEIFGKAQEIFSTLAKQRPEHSLSFVLSAEGADAVSDVVKIIEWGIGGNKPKIKTTALEIVGEIDKIPSGTPVNINLTEYEVKSMEEVVVAIEKAISSHQDGVLD